ncbi:MAG: hypothetical protein M3O70_00870 [Actinomycetota bacterium]|nr:hypothetical protein [Actinomycetota bacterium]
MSGASGAIESAKSLVGRRPAETATATAGSIGLLLSSLVDGGDEVRTGLVLLLAALPALVSYVYDLGSSKGLIHDLGQEIEELSLRAARRARLGHDGWMDDVAKATQLSELRQSLAPPRRQLPRTEDSKKESGE